MYIDKGKIFKKGKDCVTISEFIQDYHKGLNPQAIKYAIEKDLVDHTKLGSVYLVVLTKKTLAYVPNSNKNRVVESTMEV